MEQIIFEVFVVGLLLAQAIALWRIVMRPSQPERVVEQSITETGTVLRAPITVTANIPPMSKEQVEAIQEAIRTLGMVVKQLSNVPSQSGIHINPGNGMVVSGATIRSAD